MICNNNTLTSPPSNVSLPDVLAQEVDRQTKAKGDLEKKRDIFLAHLRLRPGLLLTEIPRLLGESEDFCRDLLDWMVSAGSIRIEASPPQLDRYGRYKRVYLAEYRLERSRHSLRPQEQCRVFRPGDEDYPGLPSPQCDLSAIAKSIKPKSYGTRRKTPHTPHPTSHTPPRPRSTSTPRTDPEVQQQILAAVALQPFPQSAYRLYRSLKTPLPQISKFNRALKALEDAGAIVCVRHRDGSYLYERSTESA